MIHKTLSSFLKENSKKNVNENSAESRLDTILADFVEKHLGLDKEPEHYNYNSRRDGEVIDIVSTGVPVGQIPDLTDDFNDIAKELIDILKDNGFGTYTVRNQGNRGFTLVRNLNESNVLHKVGHVYKHPQYGVGKIVKDPEGVCKDGEVMFQPFDKTILGLNTLGREGKALWDEGDRAKADIVNKKDLALSESNLNSTTEYLYVNLLDKYASSGYDKEFEEKFEAYKLKVAGYSETNATLGLKVGDVVSFISGYSDNIIYTTRILGFDEDGKAFMLWDCYWSPIDLGKRLVDDKDVSSPNVKAFKAEPVEPTEDVVTESIKHEGEPRVARMKKPDISKYSGSIGNYFPGFYIGDQRESILVDKYGTKRGEDNFQYFLGKSGNAIYAVCSDIMKEKYALIELLKLPKTSDYWKYSYIELWNKWQGVQMTKPSAVPASTPVVSAPVAAKPAPVVTPNPVTKPSPTNKAVISKNLFDD